nr:uncharacterized protein LOC129380897 [Dermacentor andersoni]
MTFVLAKFGAVGTGVKLLTVIQLTVAQSYQARATSDWMTIFCLIKQPPPPDFPQKMDSEIACALPPDTRPKQCSWHWQWPTLKAMRHSTITITKWQQTMFSSWRKDNGFCEVAVANFHFHGSFI